MGRDLAKALPVLTVFSLPIAGYLAPAIGFIFPKTLLPPQFWSSPQRLHFMLEVRPRFENHLSGVSEPSERPHSPSGHAPMNMLLQDVARDLCKLIRVCTSVNNVPFLCLRWCSFRGMYMPSAAGSRMLRNRRPLCSRSSCSTWRCSRRRLDPTAVLNSCNRRPSKSVVVSYAFG